MPEAEVECPSCGGMTKLGEIICPQCGVNLKSGEAFEARVKKAKGRAVHPEHFSVGIYALVLVAFGVCTFAGYMYHRAVAKSIVDVPEFYQYPVAEMQVADDLVAIGDRAAAAGDQKASRENYEAARKRLTELIATLKSQDEGIKPEQHYAKDLRPGPYSRRRTEKDFNQRLVKRQLNNMRAKAAHKLSLVPS